MSSEGCAIFAAFLFASKPIKTTLKGIDRPFGGEGREYAHSIRTGKREARLFFLFHFKGTSSQDQQKNH